MVSDELCVATIDHVEFCMSLFSKYFLQECKILYFVIYCVNMYVVMYTRYVRISLVVVRNRFHG